MVMLKSSFLLVSALLALGAIVPAADAASVETDIDTKPKNAPFTCVVKSTSCKSTAHFLELNPLFGPSISLTTCHHDGLWKNYWNRLSIGSGNGMYVNTFYVVTPPAAAEGGAKAPVVPAAADAPDGKCGVDSGKGKGTGGEVMTAGMVRDMLDDVINTQTECNAYIACHRADQVDDKCFPLNGDAAKKDNDKHDDK